MTRFIMSIEEAVRLVIDSASMACGGEVFITKMPVIRIQDLARVMIQELAPRFGYKPENIGIENIIMKSSINILILSQKMFQTRIIPKMKRP